MSKDTLSTDSAAPDDGKTEPVRERAVRLFRYLSAVAELRAKAVRDVASYEATFWFSELPREEECNTAAWYDVDATEEENWLRIDKPLRPDVPEPPSECANWFDPMSLEGVVSEPKLRDEIVDPKWLAHTMEGNGESEPEPPPRFSLKDFPKLPTAWENYLKTKWRPWAEKFRRWERVQSIYRKLFAVYQEQQRRGEQYELIVGVGSLVWTSNSGHRVCRPIITARATIAMERESGSITVGPPVDGANFTLEQDMLEVDERPPIQEQQAIEQKVAQLESHLDQPQITPVLKSWLQTLPSAADTSYQDSLKCPDRANRTPQMALAPILILRRRGARTMLDALRKIVKQISDGATIPRGIKPLCDMGGPSASDGSGGSADWSDSPANLDEILFPLPTNNEQIEIVHRLGERPGILVQGPPGTGKSHTIVNLLCHFLAEGKRVLVTSQTPRALKVLRQKIPQEILPLAVSLLGEDTESRQNLEYAVQGILRGVNRLSQRTIGNEIRQSAEQRTYSLNQLAKLTRQLREIREAETTAFSVPGTPYKGTAQAIAQSLSKQANNFAWFEDQIDETTEPPITNDEFKQLYSLWEQVKRPIDDQDCDLPDVAGLPSVNQFEHAIQAWSEAKNGTAQLTDKADSDTARRLMSLSQEQLQELTTKAQEFVKYSRTLSQRAETWIGRARQEAITGNAIPWSTLEQTTTKALDSLGHFADESDAEVVVSDAISRKQVLADATDLLSHLKSGKGFGIWIFQPTVAKRCKYLWQDARINGRQCNSPETLDLLIAHLKADETLVRLLQEWKSVGEIPTGTVRQQMAHLEACRRGLRVVIYLHNVIVAINGVLRTIGESVDRADAASGSAWAEQLLRSVTAAAAIRKEGDATTALSAVLRKVAECRVLPNLHPGLVEDLSSAERGDSTAFRRLLANLAILHQQRKLVEQFLTVDRKLRIVAPKLADAIRMSDLRVLIEPNIDSFQNAWTFKRAVAWLDRFCIEHSADSLTVEIKETDQQLHDATETLVAKKSWKFCLEKLSGNAQLQGALTAWQQKVKKIGKGTGKYAETHRRDARQYMQQCRNAIPVWIMPLYRVAEQVEIQPEVFDVVIVDEASQTGPEGLLLQYLGKQLIVVGDDKQISPEAGFIDNSQIRTLIDQYLAEIPFAATLDPGTSLFDQAAVRYGSRITLCEHFRCMPEIIRFSNELCYADTPLIPLRQYPPIRLPPLQVRFVTDGYREGSSQQVINRPEAAAVARQVIDCLNDPQYAAKSFGVVCLQGHAQAQIIESMILDKVGPHPFKDDKIRLVCGDPYSFQGDERDIVFLSMVASIEGEGRTAPLVREAFRQRFNVAASRARDQLWLFHSIRESDLHPDCMRRRLIHYCYNPHANDVEKKEQAYESQFERDIADDLIRAGFRVLPQFEFAGKRIDLVVEDSERRLAVECDGDTWHGPDKYDADAARQRMLERCGWKFLRIRGSVYYANRAKAARQLIDAIDAHGIKPHVASDEVVARDWVKEVSGNQCMEQLGAHAVDATERVVQPAEPAPGETFEIDESNGDVAVVTAHSDGKADNGQFKYASDIFSDTTKQTPSPATDAVSLDGVTGDAATADVIAVDSNVWFQIAHWAKQNDRLAGWQRGLAYSLGVRKRQGSSPTPKQVKQGKRILDEVAALGFKASVSETMVT